MAVLALYWRLYTPYTIHHGGLTMAPMSSMVDVLCIGQAHIVFSLPAVFLMGSGEPSIVATLTLG